MENEAFETVMAGLHEALAHARGEAVPGLVVHTPRVRANLDVAAIRRRTGASQARFAQSIGIAVSTLRTWEQGRRHPEGPARVLLALLDRNPRVVRDCWWAKADALDRSSTPRSGRASRCASGGGVWD